MVSCFFLLFSDMLRNIYNMLNNVREILLLQDLFLSQYSDVYHEELL